MYPIVDSVQIHASGNCCRTRVTGVTSFGIPAWGAPAAAVPVTAAAVPVTAAAAVGMGPASPRGASETIIPRIPLQVGQ